MLTKLKNRILLMALAAMVLTLLTQGSLAYYTTTGGKELVLEMYCASTDDLYRIQEDLFGLAQCTTYIVANHPVKQKGITPLPKK